MKSFFPELTPVDSVEEAQSWTNSDFIVKKGLSTKGKTSEEEAEKTRDFQKLANFEENRQINKPLHLSVKKQIGKKKMTPSERLKERMRNAFKKTISNDAKIAEKKKREMEMEKRSKMLYLRRSNK